MIRAQLSRWCTGRLFAAAIASIGIVIIAIVASTLSPIKPHDFTKEQQVTQSHIQELRRLCHRFRDKTGVFPGGINDLVATIPNAKFTNFLDGWNRPFAFHTNAAGDLIITSLGADNSAGGVGSNADVVLLLSVQKGLRLW